MRGLKMTNYIFIMATVMLLASTFGGLVNYYLFGAKDPDASSLPRFLFRSLAGLCREVDQDESIVLKTLNVPENGRRVLESNL
jgi:hypothetical protein